MRKIDLVFLLILIALGWLAWQLPLIPRGRPQEVVKISRDANTGRAVANILEERGILRYPRLFRAVVKLGGWDKKFQKGAYLLRRPEAWPVLIRKLTRGQRYSIKVTIPEGWTIEQIGERLDAYSITNANNFSQLAKSQNLEGRLYPTTYFFEPDSFPQEIINVMTQQFERVWQGHLEGKPLPLKFRKEDVITLASIIERETTIAQEKPIIAGVYLNRLRKGWKLEADPTVQYALGAWKSRVLYKHLQIDSPYNTYRRRGLPPGPISNPGLDSLTAVLHPSTTEFMYFIASGNGGHIFFKTLEEHNRYKRSQKKKTRITGK